MQEVTCFHCRTVVQIAPDSDHCSNCGEDLRGLLDTEHVSHYFGTRAGELAEAGQIKEALAEVERGLTYHELADLRLLAAILAEELDQYDLMRTHVAAIPVDDSLRSEAEWLVRAHQDRQRALREGAKQVRYGGQQTAGSTILADVLGVKQREIVQPRRTGMHIWTGVAATLIVVVLSLTWVATRQLSGDVVEQVNQPVQVQNQGATPTAHDIDPLANSQTEVTENPSAAENGSEDVRSEPSPVVTATTEDEPALVVTPTSPPQTIPEDLVLPASETEAIVDSNPRSVVVLTADGFDLDRLLRESGNPDLADLPLDARLQEDKLIVTGIVYLDLQRRQILELLEDVPGVQDVSTVDLLLRPKLTYEVQEGDTLWTIVYDIYGDFDRVEEFYLYNIEASPSPDALSVGDELRVPPIE